MSEHFSANMSKTNKRLSVLKQFLIVMSLHFIDEKKSELKIAQKK